MNVGTREEDIPLFNLTRKTDTMDKNASVPKVTVVVATYRREATLESAMASLLTQTHRNLEIIIVDDNADAEWNERVRIIVEKYVQTARAGYTIRLIQNENNLGSAISRNKAIFAASGDYITFLDDDDIYLPEKVKAQLQNLIENI